MVAVGCADDGRADSSPATTVAERTDPSNAVVPDLVLDGHQYRVPKLRSGGKPGDLLARQVQKPVTPLGDAKRTRYLYRSEDLRGDPVAVSAVLLTPTGDAPDGGWPIVSWGHGTTGVADVCAPSLTDNLFYNEYAQEARSYLSAGYAVVATDYVGLATPGIHSYLVGVEEGNAMVDAVSAARVLDDDLSSTWFSVGHSEGGQAAMFATRSAARAPDLDLAGAVVMAPASGLELSLPAIVGGSAPADLAYGVYVLAGLSTVDPSVDVEALLGPAGKDLSDVLLRDGCLLDALPKMQKEDLSKLFAFDQAEALELSKRVAVYGNAEVAPLVGPVLMVQGEDDEDIPVGLTDTLVEHLSDLGTKVEYRTYPGKGHDTVLGPSMCDRLEWMARHGGVTVKDCTPYETDMS